MDFRLSTFYNILAFNNVSKNVCCWKTTEMGNHDNKHIYGNKHYIGQPGQLNNMTASETYEFFLIVIKICSKKKNRP